MSRFQSLAYLTVTGVTPPVQVAAARKAGFDGVGLRVSGGRPGDGIPEIARDRGLLRETERLVKETGVRVLDVEVVRITPEWKLTDEALTFEWAARLGAENVLVLSSDEDESRTVDAFAAVCERAAEHKMRAVLEFAVFTGVKSLEQALRVIERAQQPNAGLLVDTLHLARTGVSLEALRAVSPDLLHYMQLCDATAVGPSTPEARLEEALRGRLLPGDGELPLVEVLRALPPGLAISVEAPSKALADAPPEVRAQRALEATQRVIRQSECPEGNKMGH
jgi:sugar phosphate isomerase/epimerase